MDLSELAAAAGLSVDDVDLLEEMLESEGVELDAQPAGVPRRADREQRPLSFAQERLWFLDQLEPGSAALNIPAAFAVDGALSVPALAAALEALCQRHEVLRSRYPKVEGEARQELLATAGDELPLIDLSGLAQEPREQQAERLRRQHAALPFDLSNGPLLRCALLRLAGEQHLWLFSLHHIVGDGWSMGILLEELMQLYGAAVSRKASPLSPLPVQYADYAAWQRERLSGDLLQQQVDYWRQQLAGAPAVLELPTDFARPTVQTYRGGRLKQQVDEQTADLLKSLARTEGATLFMVLLAVFKVLLSRLSGQGDVSVGTPVAGRTHRELEGLVGCFLNTLVLRTDTAGQPTVRQVVQRVRDVATEAYEHQDVSFERLLSELAPERHLSHTPLFQVFFNMVNVPMAQGGADKPGGLVLRPLGLLEAPSKFDLTVYAAEGNEGVDLEWVYNADLFSSERIAEMARQYVQLLRQAVQDPDRAASELHTHTKESRQYLPDPTATLDTTFHGSVIERFHLQVARQPDAPAVISAGETWSYAELAEVSSSLASWLLAVGLRRGQRVAVVAHRSPSLVAAVLGVLEAGGAFVLLDPAYPGPRLAQTARLAELSALISLEEAGTLSAELVSELGLDLEQEKSSLPHLQLPASLQSVRERIEAQAGTAGATTATPTRPELGAGDLAYLAFTSGSTGEPKGVCGQHGSLTHFLPWQEQAFGFGPQDRFSMLSGLAHDPLHRDLFTPLQVGAAVAVPDAQVFAAPGRLASWMARAGVTVAHLTPAMGQLLTESTPEGEVSAMPSLRWAFFVGDVLTRRDVSRLHDRASAVQVVNYFGTTETQRAVGWLPVQRQAPATTEEAGQEPVLPEILPLGQGIPGVQLLVLRAQQLAGVGEVGEIAVRSPHLALGYFRDEERSQQRFVTNPLSGKAEDRVYLTGDLGRYLPDGQVQYLGRADRQVKIRGFRVELGEIEALLGRHPGVREAAVVLREDRPGYPNLVAYYTSEGEEKPEGSDLRNFLWERLPRHLAPAAFLHLEQLPLTPNGKLDRKALPKPEPQSKEVESSSLPGNELEATIARAWCQVLELEQVGIHDNFFDLGGHSLLLVRLHGLLEKELGQEIPMLELFSYPTVSALAEHLSRGETESNLVQVDEEAARQRSARRRRRRVEL